MNPLQFLQMIKGGQNPQQLMLNFLSQNMGNPIGNNLYNLANNGDSKGIEAFARNLVQSRGLDFDTEFTKFKKSMGL